MTIYEAAKKLAANGLTSESFNTFVNKSGQRDVIEYIGLFAQFGISQDIIWEFYEGWQTSADTETNGAK